MSAGPSPQPELKKETPSKNNGERTTAIIGGIVACIACISIIYMYFRKSNYRNNSNLNKMLNNLNRRVGI